MSLFYFLKLAKKLKVVSIFVCLLTISFSISASENLDWYADFRLRFESDWDSQDSSGLERDSRDRERIRFRGGLEYTFTDYLGAGVRLRSGSDDNQRSPHITIADFNGNDEGDADINADKWFVRYAKNNTSVWLGRNAYPFWKQNELFWSDDATPIGLASSVKFSSIEFIGGAFLLPAGMHNTSGQLVGAQLVYRLGDFVVAGGYLAINADKNDVDNDLFLQQNGIRDYGLTQLHAQYTLPVPERKLRLGFDYSHNNEEYDIEDGVSPSENNEKEAIVLSIIYGATSKPRDWLLGYYYANIEQFAVNNSFSQDDWMRWGTATQTRSSNFEGHEFRVANKLSSSLTAVARLYLVESLTSVEDGKRFRIDFDWRF